METSKAPKFAAMSSKPQQFRKKSAPPILDIELIENEDSLQNGQNEKVLVKTPQVPGLDLKKVIDFGEGIK